MGAHGMTPMAMWLPGCVRSGTADAAGRKEESPRAYAPPGSGMERGGPPGVSLVALPISMLSI